MHQWAVERAPKGRRPSMRTQHVGPLPMTGSLVPTLESQFCVRWYWTSQAHFCPVGSILRWLVIQDVPAVSGVIFLVMLCLHCWRSYSAKRADIFVRGIHCGIIPFTSYLFLQLSELYSETYFTFQLYRSVFVLKLYCFDLHMGRSWEKAPWAFPCLALMSFDALLSLLIRLPRWVKSSTHPNTVECTLFFFICDKNAVQKF